jgi:Arc/MetJ-type ribon-helix-helix transcriptional regulator
MRTPITPFRLTRHDRACLDALVERLAVSRADVLRLAVRALAAREGVALPASPAVAERKSARPARSRRKAKR